MKQGSYRYNITISNQFSCECSSIKTANRRTCHHIVWPLLNLCNISKGTQLLAQVDIGRSVLENLILKVPDEVPGILTRIHSDRTTMISGLTILHFKEIRCAIYSGKYLDHRVVVQDAFAHDVSRIMTSTCMYKASFS